MMTMMETEMAVLTTSSSSKKPFHSFVRATTGYKKSLQGKPIEDAAKILRLKEAVICAIADGHGDVKCKYANIGAQIAVEVACEVLRVVCENNPNTKPLYEYIAEHRDDILKSIIQEWNKRVYKDYIERDKVVISQNVQDEISVYIESAFQPVPTMTVDVAREFYAKRDEVAHLLQKVVSLYGTTINVVLITDKFVFCAGLGDGDIVAVQGKRLDWLLPPSEQFSTTTESLCFKPRNALAAFRSVIIRKSKNYKTLMATGINPDFILIATDGLRNSFVSDDHFIDKISNIAKEKKQHYKKFQRISNKWIQQLTKDSLYQDDITFGFIY